MGMDGIEIHLNVERSFGIVIADHEARAVLTPGDLYALVLSKLPPPDSAGCVTSHAFYRLRQSLMALFSHHRSLITLSARTDTLVPSTDRRARWADLQEALELDLPALELPPSLTGLGVTALALPAAAALALGWAGHLALWQQLLLGATGIPLCTLTFRAAQAYAVIIPQRASTVGKLCQVIAQLNFARLSEHRRDWCPEEVWVSIQGIISDHMALPREAITMHAKLVDDLGIE